MEPVLAAPWRPPRLGLLSASIDGFSGGEPSPPRWAQFGVTWTPNVICDPESDGKLVWAAAKCETPAGFDTEAVPTAEEHQPLAVAVGFECGTASRDAPEGDVEARASAALEVLQHRLIESEFWTGAIAAAEGYPNAFLTDGSAQILDAGLIHPVRALAALEERAGDQIVGQAFIHVNRRISTFWQYLGLLRREGNLLLTAHDNVVVPGGGYGWGGGDYSGSAVGPFAFLTAPTVVRLGSVQSIAPTGDTISTDNLRRAWAYRAFAVTFDPCGFSAVRVDLCNLTDPCPAS